MGHIYHNWNHQHWFRVIFTYESRFRLYNCSGRAIVRWRAGERLLDCCILETDGIRGSFVSWYGDAFHELLAGHGSIDVASIMPNNLFPYARAAFQSDFVIIICARKSHGDAALTACDFLKEENIKIMEFLDRNPDLVNTFHQNFLFAHVSYTFDINVLAAPFRQNRSLFLFIYKFRVQNSDWDKYLYICKLTPILRIVAVIGSDEYKCR